MLDEQHKKILSIIGDLYTPILECKNEVPIKKTLSSLQIYTEIHFQYEEILLKFAKYNELKEHRKIQEEMTKKTTEFTFIANKDEKGISFEILNFLKDWWNNHIKKIDDKYISAVSKLDL